MNEYSSISTNAQPLASTSISALKKQSVQEKNEISGFEVAELPLTHDILREIFKHLLKPEDRCSVRETSKQFKECLDSTCWGRCFSAYALSDTALCNRFHAFFECESYSEGVKNSLSKSGIHLIPKEYAQMSVLTGVSSLFKLELSDECFSAIRDAPKSGWTLKECCYALELLGKHGHGCDNSIKAAESICLELKSRKSRDKSNWTVEERCHLLDLISRYCMTFKWEAASTAEKAVNMVFCGSNQYQFLSANIKVFSALLNLYAVIKNEELTQKLLNSLMMNVNLNRFNPLHLIEIAAVMQNHQHDHGMLWDIKLINNLLLKSIELRCYNPNPDIPDRLFHLITSLNSRFNPKTCALLLKLCAHGLNLVNANALLFGGDGSSGLINKWGLKLNVSMCNAFITICGKTGNIDKAWGLVSGKNPVMTPQHDLAPNAITCLNLLTACAEAGDIPKAELLLFGKESMPALIQRWDVKLDAAMCNTFITMCGKTENIDKAWELLFGENAVMTPERGLTPDVFTFVNLLTACAEAGNFNKAELLLFGDKNAPGLIKQRGVKLDVRLLNVFITVCGKTGNLDKAWILLFGIKPLMTRDDGLPPNSITCVNLLTACAEAGDFNKAELLLFGNESSPGLIKRRGIKLTVPMCNAFITVCGKTGNLDKAWALVSGQNAVMTPHRGLPPNAITCVNLLTACAEAGDFNKAMKLLFGDEGSPGLIQRWGIKLTVPMCNAFITVCGKTGNLDMAWELLLGENAVMTPGNGLLPNATTCVNMLTTCAEAGDFNKAVLLLFGRDGKPGLIKLWGIKLDVTMCDAFITVCGKTGNLDKAWELLFGENAVMTPENGLPPNATTCVNMLTACAEAGDFNKAVLLLFGRDGKTGLIKLWGIKLDVTMCDAFITVCGKTGNIGAAKVYLIKIMEKSGVSVTTFMKARLASLESEKFQENVENGIRSNLYHHNLGITQNSLNLHINKIFKTSSDDADNRKGVPLEFAKLLFRYLKDIRGQHITSIITGYHGKHTLRDGMITFIKDKYKLTFVINKFNRGELNLADRS